MFEILSKFKIIKMFNSSEKKKDGEYKKELQKYGREDWRKKDKKWKDEVGERNGEKGDNGEK